MFVKTFFLLALASVVLGSPAKIIGGRPVAQGEIGFQVSIQDRNGQHYCGGAIVDFEFVLTVASCVEKIIGQVYVIAGTVLLSEPHVSHRASIVTPHPNFTIEGSIPHSDIAIIQVTPRFVFDSTTGCALMTQQDYAVPVDTNCTVAGWGTTSLGGVSSNEMLRTEVPVWDTTECRAVYSDIHMLPPQQICAGRYEGGADACDRDNGSPLFYSGVVYGVFSWGGGCGQVGRPGVYTEVSAHRDWIDSVIV